MSTGPLAILSLLPSALLSGIAWIAKRSLVSPSGEPSKEQPPDRDEVDLNGLYSERKMINPILALDEDEEVNQMY